MENRIIEIFWVDAESVGDSGWQSLEESQATITSPSPIMKTCGYVLHEATDFIVVTDSLGTEECGQITKIPSCMVQSIHELGYMA
jgi:hypothetical protein